MPLRTTFCFTNPDDFPTQLLRIRDGLPYIAFCRVFTYICSTWWKKRNGRADGSLAFFSTIFYFTHFRQIKRRTTAGFFLCYSDLHRRYLTWQQANHLHFQGFHLRLPQLYAHSSSPHERWEWASYRWHYKNDSRKTNSFECRTFIKMSSWNSNWNSVIGHNFLPCKQR